jgi:hypothetical protein
LSATTLHPFDVPGIWFTDIQNLVPDSGVVSGSIRNSRRKARILKGRDAGTKTRGTRRFDESLYTYSNCERLKDRWFGVTDEEILDDDLVFVPGGAPCSRLEETLMLVQQMDERRRAARHRALEVVHEMATSDQTSRRPRKNRRRRRSPKTYIGIERLMTERYGVPVS